MKGNIDDSVITCDNVRLFYFAQFFVSTIFLIKSCYYLLLLLKT